MSKLNQTREGIRVIETLIMYHFVTEQGQEEVGIFLGNETLASRLADQYPNVNYFNLDIHLTRGKRGLV